MRIVIGIDPDSDRHGVATFIDGKLKSLDMLPLMSIMTHLVLPYKESKQVTEFSFAIEDVVSNTFIYSRNVRTNSKVQSTIARSIGACQQSQSELVRMLEHYGVEYTLHKPTSTNWAKNTKRFQSLTGWSGRSNEDTRSAAYFGFIAAKTRHNPNRVR